MENINTFPMIYKHRINSAGMVPIVICITINNKPVAYEPLHKRVLLSDWDPEKRKVKDDLLNSLIKKRIAELEEIFIKKMLADESITGPMVKKILAGEHQPKNFFEYAEYIINNKTLADGLPYNDDTRRRYRDEIKRLKQFQPHLFLSDITTPFLNQYRKWLLNDYRKKDKTKLHKNSIWKTFGFIRMIWRCADKDRLVKHENNPFQNFEVGSFETDLQKIKYLELSQLEIIEQTLITKESLMDPFTIRVGWRFLAMCVFGLRISDAMRLDEGFINDAGYLDFTPFKTRRHGNTAQVPIVNDRQKRYLSKTFELPLPAKNHKSFRTDFNDHLKIITAMSGISIHLTSHVGRHTMGSFLVDGDVTEKSAMVMLGVKSDRVIKTYMHLKQSKLISEANKLNNVM